MSFWNSADKGASVVLRGFDDDSTIVAGGTYNMIRSAKSTASGVDSFEGTCVASTTVIGFSNAAQSLTSYVGQTSGSWGYFTTGVVYHNGAAVASGLTNWNTTDVIKCEYDADAGEIKWYINGTLAYTATGVSGTLHRAIAHNNNGHAICRPGKYAATITFASGAITDAAGNAVTESGVIASVCDRATGLQLSTTTANVSGGGATLSFTADVTNGQNVVVHFHNTIGTLKAGGFLGTVVV